ncbi:MAG: type II and III secretion system protein family protein [Gemmatimonadota bacterium]
MSGNRIFARLAAPILTLAFLFVATPVAAQDDSGVLNLATGGQSVIETPATVTRVAIADPSIIDVLPVTGRELVINGKAAGTTSLLVWDAAGTRSAFNVKVSPDAANLQSDLRRLFPGEDVSVVNNGRTVVLTGNASNSGVSSRIARMARASLGDSAMVVNELELPQPGQILLKVRFAEVSRSALERAGVNLLYRGDDGTVIGSSTGRPAPFSGDLDGTLGTLSDAVNLFAFSPDLNMTAFLAALESNGVFRSLAEPNLLASHGVEASFLAGGEFPYPVLQGGASSGGVSIVFKEFGIKLDFTPFIQPGGNIRLVVAPEVSSLDFANGLTIAGFNIPSILTRKASTEIELAEGQTFAIAGLIDNNMVTDYDKVPVLGDIPILGSLFRSKEIRQNRSELLVLVTPYVMQPEDEMPEIPGGEPDTWNWERHLEGDMPSPEEEGRVRELENRERGEARTETTDDDDADAGDAETDDEPLTNE